MLGETVQLNCLASGVPSPRITWTKAAPASKGSAAVSGSSSFSDLRNAGVTNHRVLANGTLVMERVGAANEGKYLCKAENGVGEPISKLVEVDINSKVFLGGGTL